ncbi:MAG: GTPase Era [Campylobacter sp.]|nr:GTPase Era [Campylobacter sp.]
METKSGFVSLIGRTNSGKSSLINYLVRENLCMVSHKINATRRKITGIVMHDKTQIIFTDTPGLHKSSKIMNQTMIELAIKSIGDADLVLFVSSVSDDTRDYEEFLSKFSSVNHLLILSKIDTVNKEFLFKKMQSYSKFSSYYKGLIPLSIKKQAYRKILLGEISKYIPQNEYYYPPDLISATNSKEIYRDLILQAVYESVSSEIPYSTDVIINKVVEKPNHILIVADIITDSDSKKSILIGKDGVAIKRVGIRAKKLIAAFENLKISINLRVLTKKGWNSNENLIKREFIY